MTPERWAEIEELFHRVADCEAEQRTSLLDEACDGDSELRQQVEVLLASEESAGNRMQAAVHGGLDAMTFPLVGKTVSHYHILDGLGGGGMGLVYRAEDIKLGRQVALKFLPEDSAKDPAALGRFEREARSASALEHPNICPIYEFGEHEGQPFLVMQLLQGQTLRDWLPTKSHAKPSMAISKVLDLALQIAEGLQAAHRHGIIHRDIKPANIFITDKGQAKILDFGLAKLASGGLSDEELDHVANGLDKTWQTAHDSSVQATPDRLLSRTGVAMGTAGYMSPEQVRGENLDSRTDLFSFGLVLYEMVAGQRAFPGDTIPELHAAILDQGPTPLRELNLGVSSKLETVINRALEKDRQLRYQTASEMRAALESLSSETKRERFGKRWRLVGVAAALLAATGAFLWYRAPKHSPNPLPDLKQVQLTANSSENLVEDGAISPDGEYLAYADRRAIQIKEIKSGAVRSIAPPDIPAGTELPPGSVSLAWFPDSVRLAVTANTTVLPEPDSFTSPQCTGIWVLSRLDGELPRKIRDDGCIQGVSPDGAWIAFTRNGQRSDQFGNQIWLMGPNGEQPHPLFERDEHSRYEAIRWSPNGDRLTYALTREKGDNLSASVQSRDLQGGTPVTIFTSVQEGTLGGCAADACFSLCGTLAPRISTSG